MAVSTKTILAFEDSISSGDVVKNTETLRQRLTSSLCEDVSTTEKEEENVKKYRLEIVWSNVFKFVILHCVAFAGIMELPNVSFYTLLWAFFTFWISSQGITAGAHRLWTHRSYKARLPLKLFLLMANAMAAQNSVIVWSRDHRVHHKYSETDADPHNAKRGFFFAHVSYFICFLSLPFNKFVYRWVGSYAANIPKCLKKAPRSTRAI